ncbi:MAG TPA: GHMP kinase [Candidatus Diapherotrites archaeon]|uniref:GHMP kinase n=1 Tax=Candidatus Iainarchaeum sp. TaxID=3101447 RepID=A0A7J4IZ54_9ARCH|nr:GHMP kinase [Candidatus Diapherotrites archaeon]
MRISFAGGGTDVSPYPQERSGCVLSATISKYSFTSLKLLDSRMVKISSHGTQRAVVLSCVEEAVLDGEFDLAKTVLMEFSPQRGIDLFFRNDVPPRSGLGSSAAGFVSLIGAFDAAFGHRLTKHEIAELAFKIERERLKVRGGKQDQFASAYGGINFMEFNANGVEVKSLCIGRGTLNELEKNLVLVFTKEREKHGTDIIEDQTDSFRSGSSTVGGALDAAKQTAIEMKGCLLKGDLERFGQLLHKGWEEKKKYSTHITTPFIDGLYDAARKEGAIGGKITGAGGGGYMIFYCEPDREIAVRERLTQLGAIPVPFSFEFNGLESWKVE